MWVKIRAWLKRARYEPLWFGLRPGGQQPQVPAWKYNQLQSEITQLRARHDALVAGYTAHLETCDPAGDGAVVR